MSSLHFLAMQRACLINDGAPAPSSEFGQQVEVTIGNSCLTKRYLGPDAEQDIWRLVRPDDKDERISCMKTSLFNVCIVVCDLRAKLQPVWRSVYGNVLICSSQSNLVW